MPVWWSSCRVWKARFCTRFWRHPRRKAPQSRSRRLRRRRLLRSPRRRRFEAESEKRPSNRVCYETGLEVEKRCSGLEHRFCLFGARVPVEYRSSCGVPGEFYSPVLHPIRRKRASLAHQSWWLNSHRKRLGPLRDTERPVGFWQCLWYRTLPLRQEENTYWRVTSTSMTPVPDSRSDRALPMTAPSMRLRSVPFIA